IVRSAPEIAFTIIGHDAVPCIEAFLKSEETGRSIEAMLAEAGKSIRALLEPALTATGRPPRETFAAALAKREQLKAALRELYRQHNIEALAHPPIMCPPPRIADGNEVEILGRKLPLRAVMGRNIALSSCGSMASLVLPAGETSDGLPIGLEFDALAGQ